MSSILEKKSFKWIAIGAGSLVTILLVVAALVVQKHRHDEKEAKREAERAAVYEYETRVRSSLVRIYQNLKIDHFLAAYKNLDGVEVPSPRFVEIYREYHEVLYRISKGLIENDFLNEVEPLLLRLQAAREFEDRARELLIQVASRRRWKSARAYVEDGKGFLKAQKYRDAVTEFLKAKAEYESVKLFKIHDVDADLQALAHLIREARFEIAFSQAHVNLQEAQQSIQGNFFVEAVDRVRKAGDMVARAAYYGGARPEVVGVRKRLLELEAELAFRVPNSIPVWNLIDPKNIESSPDYFHLDAVKMDVNSSETVGLKLDYRLRTRLERAFVLRVKVSLSDGRFFFDGKVIAAESPDKDEKRSEDFILQFPPALKGLGVKKISVEIHDKEDTRYSYVQRAFKLASPS